MTSSARASLSAALLIDWTTERDGNQLVEDWTIIDAAGSFESEDEGKSDWVAIGSAVDSGCEEPAPAAAATQQTCTRRVRLRKSRGLRCKLTSLSAEAAAQAHGIVNRASMLASKAKSEIENRGGLPVNSRAGFRMLKEAAAEWKSSKYEREGEGLTPMEAVI
jgi:hypothetical protein